MICAPLINTHTHTRTNTYTHTHSIAVKVFRLTCLCVSLAMNVVSSFVAHQGWAVRGRQTQSKTLEAGLVRYKSLLCSQIALKYTRISIIINFPNFLRDDTPNQGHQEFPFRRRKLPPAKAKIPENSRSVKYFILHTPVPKSATFVGSIYNNGSFCLTLHATLVILVFNHPLLSPVAVYLSPMWILTSRSPPRPLNAKPQ